MAIKCVIGKWVDVNNKDYNDRNALLIVNHNYQAESLPLSGLDADLEVFVNRSGESPFPEEDSRLVIIGTDTWVRDEIDEEYTQNRVYNTRYTVEARTGEDLKDSIEAQEETANGCVMPHKKRLKMAVGLAYVIDKLALIDDSSVPDNAKALLTEIRNDGLKIYQNHLIAAAKKEQVDNSEQPDIDSDWHNV